MSFSPYGPSSPIPLMKVRVYSPTQSCHVQWPIGHVGARCTRPHASYGTLVSNLAGGKPPSPPCANRVFFPINSGKLLGKMTSKRAPPSS